MADQPTGPALDREVERVCFNDDLSCFDAEGNERRERIAEAILGFAEVVYCGYLGDQFIVPGFEPEHFFVSGGDHAVALAAWGDRNSKPYQPTLEAHVSAYRAEPRPFSRDVRLAMGLLGDENFNVHRHGNEITVILGDMAAIGKFRVEGTARLSEFPSAKDDAERREWAMATAISRAVLASKG